MSKGISSPLVISIGIDGGTWKIIEEGTQRGFFETIQSIARMGCSGILKSYPPITYPQWYVLLSGFNPGNIGVFSFVKYNPYDNEINITSHGDFKSPMIGDFLTKLGIRFAIINTPGIVPRSVEYKGYIVGDPFLPSPKYYPRSLSGILSVINYKNYDYRISKSMISAFPKKEILNIAKSLVSKRFKLARYLLKKDHKIRFIHLTVFVNDNIQHFFGLDSDITLHLWSYIDSKIRELMNFIENEYKNDYIINIVSDHGFSNVHTVYNIGKDLENKNYIKSRLNLALKIMSRLGINRTNIGKIIDKPIIGDIINILLKSDRIRKTAQKFVPDPAGDDPLANIDLEESKVIYTNSGLHVTRKYIDMEKSLERDLIKYFANLRTPYGNEVFLLADSREKIFYGKYIKYAPNIVLIPRPGVHVTNKPGRSEIFWNPLLGVDWVADHTPEAIFITYGPQLSSSCRVMGYTMDYTPTLLELLGASSALGDFNLDGNPLKAVIDKYEL